MWSTDEMCMPPERFARRVAGILSHESLHVILDKIFDDDFKTSLQLDNFFAQVYPEDDSTHGQ